MERSRKSVVVLAAAFLLTPQLALASGYLIRESSADAMGTAYAGSAATNIDASFMAFNPAALGGVRDLDVSESIAAIIPDNGSHYSATTSAGTPVAGPGSPDNFISDAAIPSLAARWRVTNRLALGVAVTAPWGLSTKYPEDWVGRYYVIESKLKTINISPLLSFEVAPGIDIAAGLQAQYASGTLSSAIDVGTLAIGSGGTPGGDDIRARFKGRGWAFGWTVGAMAQPNDAISLGVSYRSAITTTARGHLTFEGVSTNPFAVGIGVFNDGPASTELTTPAILALGARWRLQDRWTLLGEVDWTEWSVFKHLLITASSPALNDFTAMNWRDSWFFALGAEYALDDRWTLKGGTAFDETPVPASTRSPRLADNNRTWIAIGARYHVSDSFDASLSYAHLFYPDSKIDLHQTDPGSALRGNLSGMSESATNIFAVQLDFHTT